MAIEDWALLFFWFVIVAGLMAILSIVYGGL